MSGCPVSGTKYKFLYTRVYVCYRQNAKLCNVAHRSADAAHGLGGHIVSDGGCVCPGDVSKAFGAGADFVMLGGMFAGHDESGGEIMEENGQKYKV